MSRVYADHGWFTFRDQSSQPPLDLGADTRVGIHLVIHIQAFHIDAQPAAMTPGLLDRPYPDVTNWSQRKVGLRDGLARLCRYLDQNELAATFVVEADAIDEVQAVMSVLAKDRYSIVAGGRHAALLQSAFTDADEEKQYIEEVMARIKGRFDNAVDGWRSPFGVHSPHTLAALAASGVRYTLDLNNDECPYEVTTDAGPMTSLPYQHFAGDLHCLHVAKQPTADYLADLTAGVDWLTQEARSKGVRLLTVPLHPWIIGAPHRFAQLKDTLDNWKGRPGLRFIGARELADGK